MSSAPSPVRHARAHRWRRPTRFIRQVVDRKKVDGGIDLLRLRLDTIPHGLYQPVASLPRWAGVTRAEGSESRWKAILPVLRRSGATTAVDIGANAGYFTIQLAHAGVATVAVEGDPINYRTAIMAVRRSGVPNAGVLALSIDQDNHWMVPNSDCSLLLSVWHHLVREGGIDYADELLAAIWAKTGKVLFFDTGEQEMPPEFGLPRMSPDPRTWLEGHLAQNCPGSEVEHLGVHAAFDAEGRPAQRNLFAVHRTAG
jgi:hypothetical protein